MYYIFYRVLCTGSKDRRTRVVAAERLKNLNVYDLGGLRDVVVGSYFDYNSLDVSFGDVIYWYDVLFFFTSFYFGHIVYHFSPISDRAVDFKFGFNLVIKN